MEKNEKKTWRDVNNIALMKHKNNEVTEMLDELVENEFLKSKRMMLDVVDGVHEMEQTDVEEGLEFCRPLAKVW